MASDLKSSTSVETYLRDNRIKEFEMLHQHLNKIQEDSKQIYWAEPTTKRISDVVLTKKRFAKFLPKILHYAGDSLARKLLLLNDQVFHDIGEKALIDSYVLSKVLFIQLNGFEKMWYFQDRLYNGDFKDTFIDQQISSSNKEIPIDDSFLPSTNKPSLISKIFGKSKSEVAIKQMDLSDPYLPIVQQLCDIIKRLQLRLNPKKLNCLDKPEPLNSFTIQLPLFANNYVYRLEMFLMSLAFKLLTLNAETCKHLVIHAVAMDVYSLYGDRCINIFKGGKKNADILPYKAFNHVEELSLSLPVDIVTKMDMNAFMRNTQNVKVLMLVESRYASGQDEFESFVLAFCQRLMVSNEKMVMAGVKVLLIQFRATQNQFLNTDTLHAFLFQIQPYINYIFPNLEQVIPLGYSPLPSIGVNFLERTQTLLQSHNKYAVVLPQPTFFNSVLDYVPQGTQVLLRFNHRDNDYEMLIDNLESINLSENCAQFNYALSFGVQENDGRLVSFKLKQMAMYFCQINEKSQIRFRTRSILMVIELKDMGIEKLIQDMREIISKGLREFTKTCAFPQLKQLRIKFVPHCLPSMPAGSAAAKMFHKNLCAEVSLLLLKNQSFMKQAKGLSCFKILDNFFDYKKQHVHGNYCTELDFTKFCKSFGELQDTATNEEFDALISNRFSRQRMKERSKRFKYLVSWCQRTECFIEKKVTLEINVF